MGASRFNSLKVIYRGRSLLLKHEPGEGKMSMHTALPQDFDAGFF